MEIEECDVGDGEIVVVAYSQRARANVERKDWKLKRGENFDYVAF